MERVMKFLRDQRGTMTWTTLSFTLLALLAGGVSIDVMRHEGTRARVQQALDFCTMNTAAVQQPGTVASGNTTTTNTQLSTAIKGCMDKLGPGALVSGVAASSTGGTFKPVDATATGTQNNQFMQMLNKNTIGLSVASTAGISTAAKVEVSLAYEASNNMSASSATLKTGLKAFVTRLTDTSGSVVPSVTVVPYSAGVNLTAAMLAKYSAVTNVSTLTNSNCIDLPATDFGKVAMPVSTTGYKTMLIYDVASTTTFSTTSPTVTPTGVQGTANTTTSVPCTPYTAQMLRPQQDGAAQTAINTAIDSTSFFSGLRWDHGMHWAAAMLDPTANAAMGTLGAASVNTRPLAYNSAGLQKVIVFVNKNGTGADPADGVWPTLATAYTTGLSPIYRNAAVTPAEWCIDLPTRPSTTRAYFQFQNTWKASCVGTQLTWPEVWKQVRVKWVAWSLYGRGMTGAAAPTAAAVQTFYDSYMATVVQGMTFDAQTTNFLAECTAAKAAGIVIYTVGMDAIARAKTPLASCATSPAHYFDATSANFADVMKVIAQTINQQGYSQ